MFFPRIQVKCMTNPFMYVIILGSACHQLMCDIVEDDRMVKDVKQLSPGGQTSSLEAFHSLINNFAPKMYHFHYRSMYTRYITYACVLDN